MRKILELWEDGGQFFIKAQGTPPATREYTSAPHLMPSDDGPAPVKEEQTGTAVAADEGIWTRHGTWMDGNRVVARMYRRDYRNNLMVYYEDCPEVRRRKLPIVPEHIALRLEQEASIV